MLLNFILFPIPISCGLPEGPFASNSVVYLCPGTTNAFMRSTTGQKTQFREASLSVSYIPKDKTSPWFEVKGLYHTSVRCLNPPELPSQPVGLICLLNSTAGPSRRHDGTVEASKTMWLFLGNCRVGWLFLTCPNLWEAADPSACKRMMGTFHVG